LVPGAILRIWAATHGQPQYFCRRYLYRLTDKGLARSLFNRKPDQILSVKLETAYRKADGSIQKIVDFLAA
jgi:hypothetical protein